MEASHGTVGDELVDVRSGPLKEVVGHSRGAARNGALDCRTLGSVDYIRVLLGASRHIQT